MSILEKTSLNFANKLGEKLNKSKEEVAVLNYGLFVILHTSISVIITIIVGIITGLFKEILVISLCSAILKRYSGGIHASTPERCLAIGISIASLLAFLCKLFVNILNPIMFLILLIIGISVSYFVLYKRCPVGSKQKPLKKESKRIMMRKKSFNLMNLYCIIMIVLYIIYIVLDNNLTKSMSMSILFGILMQIFALSKIGANIIIGIDKILDR